MRIMAFGKDLSGNLLFPPEDEDRFVASLVSTLGSNGEHLKSLTSSTRTAVVFRDEVARRVQDAGNPLTAGWTFVVAEDDPHKAEVIEALEPLARHRGMQSPRNPLIFAGQAENDWDAWMAENFFDLALGYKRVPQYILLVGSPKFLPFRLQSLLDTFANVGRVEFDQLSELTQYVQKIIRLETATPDDLTVKREVLLFGPDAGPRDPTYFSREYMVDPLAEYIRDKLDFGTTALTAHDATKQNLVEALHKQNPAIVYTASHGLGLKYGETTLQEQMQYNGAICCQSEGEYFTGDDVPPPTEPFLEGSVFFQFACFGYGTPAQSDYAHWISTVPESYADQDFIAALPKRLLAHPRGPVAYIGHLDTAFLHGFTNQNDPYIAGRWHDRMYPFVAAVTNLLDVQPSGLAMQDMNDRFSRYNAMLTSEYDQQRRKGPNWVPQSTQRFVDRWIVRGDAQNYMVFGDPAARLRIPTT